MTTAVVTMASTTLERLFDILKRRGYTLVGPTVQGQAVVLEPLKSVADLPSGWRDRQATGTYALEQTSSKGYFQFACGPDSWKRFLMPPASRLYHVAINNGGVVSIQGDQSPPVYAFVGMRACDLKALAILDDVIVGQSYPDPYYQAVRRHLFIVAVNCPQPGDTCFCTAMGAGPRADAGYDLVLDEIETPERHDFIVAPGSSIGSTLLADLQASPASPEDLEAVRSRSERAETAMLASMADPLQMAAILEANFDSPHWEAVEQRCLACGNCTLVCPTCFCHTVEEIEFMDPRQAARRRLWDSCFNREFSYIHGGSIRESIASRYRQWLTHKLAYWPRQFGSSGCVGCGRCRTWCPAGIDLIEEVCALADDGRQGNG